MGVTDILNREDITMRNNIWDVHDNLILKKDGSVFAIYEIPPQIINSIDGVAKEQTKENVFGTFLNIVSYKDYEIAMIPMDKELVSIYDKLSLDIDWEGETADLAEYILNGQLSNLYDSIGTIFDYKYFMLVPLKSIHVSADLKEVLRQSYRQTRNTVMGMLGFREGVPLEWYKSYETQLSVLDSDLSSFSPKSLNTFETFFMLRLYWVGGMYYDKDFEVTTVASNIENLDEVNIEFHNVNIIKLSIEYGSCYKLFLPVDELPDNVSYLHLQEEIQTLPFPIESRFKVQFSSTKGVMSVNGRSKRARKRVNNVIDEADEAGDVQKGAVIRGSLLLEDLQEKINDNEIIVRYLNTLIITGTTIDELMSKYELLFSTLKNMGIGLVRASADQLYLMYKNRPTEVLTGTDKNFVQEMTLEAFCENLFFVTRKVGNEVGFVIGRVDNQIASWRGDYQKAINASVNLVCTNLLQANKLNVEGKTTNNPHTAVIGETGSGKSFLIKLLFTYHSLLKMQCLYIDPKREMRQQYMKVLKELEDSNSNEALQRYIRSINFVTLDAREKSNHGVLDPMVFLTNDQEATDLADSMISSVLNDKTDIVEKGYLSAIKAVLKRRAAGERVGMLHVFRTMKESDVETVASAGELLEFKADDSILSLCFSDGSNPSIDLTSKITILEIAGLDLPKNEGEEITKSQQKSLVVLYGLGYFCKRFGERDRTVETMSVIDEVWQYISTTIGRGVLKEMKRIGRSYNNFMLFGTQSVKDVDTEDDSTGFGTVFAFLEKTEIDDVLKYMHIPVTDETREWMANMTTGQCIYYDTFGRRERITIDGMFPEIVKLFDTVESHLQAV